jgi:hypothetical protein
MADYISLIFAGFLGGIGFIGAEWTLKKLKERFRKVVKP